MRIYGDASHRPIEGTSLPDQWCTLTQQNDTSLTLLRQTIALPDVPAGRSWARSPPVRLPAALGS